MPNSKAKNSVKKCHGRDNSILIIDYERLKILMMRQNVIHIFPLMSCEIPQSCLCPISNHILQNTAQNVFS